MRNWRYVLLVSLGLFACVACGAFVKVREAQNVISKTLEIWEPELVEAMSNDRMFMVDRIGKSLLTDTVQWLHFSRSGSNYFSIPALTESSSCFLKTELPINHYGALVGKVTYCQSLRTLLLATILSPLFWFALSGLLAITLSVQLFSLRGYRTSLLDTLAFLRRWAVSIADDSLSSMNAFQGHDQVTNELVKLVREGTDGRMELEKMRATFEKRTLKFEVAAQVAHDIRSPLAALTMAEKDLTTLPEDTRLMIRSAVGRIRDIANHLLEKNRAENEIDRQSQAGNTQTEAVSTQLILSLIEEVITEKRIQFRSKIGVDIDNRLDVTSYGLFSNVQPTELKRVLSNLVNNSLEAISGRGTVTISLEAKPEDLIEIRVHDNGKGITAEILARLGQRGETHGKEGGSGLGLFHARTSIEFWGGRFDLQSEFGYGTTATIVLPRAVAPSWFVGELFLFPHSYIVALDDDESIHRIWQRRTDSDMLQEFGIKLVHLSTPSELRAWKTQAFKQGLIVQYLLDFELLGFAETGLDLIEELGIAAQSILVTSRYEESGIRERCLGLKVPLIPKGMAGFVPIFVTDEVDAILIDDDALVHMNWKLSAKRAGVRFQGFQTVDAFFDIAKNLALTTPIYLDSLLGKNEQGLDIRGEEVAHQIFEMGFKEIYLATGRGISSFEQMPWLTGIRGKEPPFTEPDYRRPGLRRRSENSGPAIEQPHSNRVPT